MTVGRGRGRGGVRKERRGKRRGEEVCDSGERERGKELLERKGKERKGKERKGKERKGKERGEERRGSM